MKGSFLAGRGETDRGGLRGEGAACAG